LRAHRFVRLEEVGSDRRAGADQLVDDPARPPLTFDLLGDVEHPVGERLHTLQQRTIDTPVALARWRVGAFGSSVRPLVHRPTTPFTALTIFPGFGRYACSRFLAYGVGTSSVFTRTGWWSRWSNARSTICVIVSLATEPNGQHWSTTTTRFVFFTDSMIESMSSGRIVRMSSTSTSMPSLASCSAASTQKWTGRPQLTSVQSPPSRTLRATPKGM